MTDIMTGLSGGSPIWPAVAGGRDGGRCDPTDDPEQLGGVRDRPGIRIEGQAPATTVDKAWSVGLLANLELAERPYDPPAADLTGLDLSGSFVSGYRRFHEALG